LERRNLAPKAIIARPPVPVRCYKRIAVTVANADGNESTVVKAL